MYRIAVLPGDGIGAEIVPEAVKALQAIGEKYGHRFDFQEGLVGGTAIDAVGKPLPDETLKLCQESQAVLLGAIGGPKWEDLPVELRPEVGALCPCASTWGCMPTCALLSCFPDLVEASTLKPEVIRDIDILVVRVDRRPVFWGEKPEAERGGEIAVDVCTYSDMEIERICRLAFEIARKRRKHLTSVDKANVIETSRLWREVVSSYAEYPDVELTHMYVDNCAMQLIRHPRQFDVIVTENLFGTY